MTLAALAEETKIPRAHLDALERGDASHLPPFYQRAEVRAVARALGLDERHAVSRLESFLPRVEPPLPWAPEPARRVRSEYVYLAGAAVLAAWMLGWGPFARSGAGSQTPAMETAAPDAVTASALEPVEPEPLATAAEPAPLVEAENRVSPQPATVVGTELVIRTQPEGARVTVDGIGWGVSPVTIRHIEPGDKHVRLTLNGYRAVERSVAIDEGAREAMTVRLTEFRAP